MAIPRARWPVGSCKRERLRRARLEHTRAAPPPCAHRRAQIHRTVKGRQSDARTRSSPEAPSVLTRDSLAALSHEPVPPRRLPSRSRAGLGRPRFKARI